MKPCQKKRDEKLFLEVSCFRCDRVLNIEHYSLTSDPLVITPVYGGLRFRTMGNYGSTIFDPRPHVNRSDDLLEIVVCDRCVTEKKKNVKHIYDVITTKSSKVKQFDEDS